MRNDIFSGYKDADVYEALEPGGHKCIVKNVRQETSQKGKPMIVIYLDTAPEDKQPGFFMNRYLKNAQPDKKWPGTGKVYITLKTEYTAANIKRFCTAVNDSNDGFFFDGEDEDQQDHFEELMKDKKVGVVFRREMYSDPVSHEARASVKPFRFCKYDTAADQPVPDAKGGTNESLAAKPEPQPDAFGFIPADALEDEGLPFR